MNFVLPGFDLFEDVISADFKIFNDTSELELHHSEGNGEDLDFLVPDQTINLQLEDLLGQFFKILFLFINLNVEDDNGFSGGFFLGGLGGNSFFLLLGQLLLGSLVFFGVGSEKIDFVFIGSGLLGGFGSLERGHGSGGEVAQSAIIEIEVGIFVFAGDGLQSVEDGDIFLGRLVSAQKGVLI